MHGVVCEVHAWRRPVAEGSLCMPLSRGGAGSLGSCARCMQKPTREGSHAGESWSRPSRTHARKTRPNGLLGACGLLACRALRWTKRRPRIGPVLDLNWAENGPADGLNWACKNGLESSNGPRAQHKI